MIPEIKNSDVTENEGLTVPVIRTDVGVDYLGDPDRTIARCRIRKTGHAIATRGIE
jgi:hypothetical protein